MAKPKIAKNKTPVTWVLVADGGYAQVFTRGEKEKRMPLLGTRTRRYEERKEYALIPMPEWELKAESAEEFEMGNNQRGRVVASAGLARHAADPHEDVHEAVKRRFMKAIAEKLNKAKAEEAFDRLALVAPSRRLGELREFLSTQALAAVMMEMPKDLTHYGSGEIEKYLEQKA